MTLPSTSERTHANQEEREAAIISAREANNRQSSISKAATTRKTTAGKKTSARPYKITNSERGERQKQSGMKLAQAKQNRGRGRVIVSFTHHEQTDDQDTHKGQHNTMTSFDLLLSVLRRW